MIVLWSLLLVASLLLTVVSSRRAVREASDLATRLRLPPFLVGLTLVAVGTDLPEIANSIVASLAGHGDLNVGDSVGSVVTQITLVLGLLPFLAGAFKVGRSQVVLSASLTALALLFGALFVADGELARAEAAVLVSGWIVASAVVWKYASPHPRLPFDTPVGRGSAWRALLFLALVGLGAGGSVAAFVQLSKLFGFPEYLISFFVASLGTSLPELVVDVQALKRGASALAVGDAFGSSLVDSTLSIGIGPLLAPTAVTASLAVRGAVAGAGVLIVIALLFSRIAVHDRRSGLLLLLLYAAFYPLLLSR